MFSTVHIIWLIICAAVIAASLIYIKKCRITLDKILNVCCAVCVISEVIKVFSMMELVPSADGSTMYPYMMPQHLPFHLCSIQIIIIFFVRFAADGKVKEAFTAFLYPTCIFGAVLALMIPSIFTGGTIELSQGFTHPLAYQYFLYHAMLIILGAGIVMTGETDIRRKHYLSTVGILGVLAFISVYLNSWLAAPTYVSGELVHVDYTPNFFFTVKLPFDIVYTEIWQWYLYVAGIAAAGLAVIALFYIPFLRKK
ncbi:MAG: YwaF family protein [Firmicutes bacterium]|nr:YwaF family protein [Bacillota bacterium]